MVVSASLDLASPASLMRSLGHEPSPAQATFLASSGPRACFAAGRGAGKTTAGLVLALHAALSGAGRLVLVVAPSSPDVTGLYGRMVGMCQESGCGFFSRRAQAMLSFENGSTVRLLVASGPERFRGYRPDLVVVDRAELIPANVKDALAGLLRPGSRLVALEDA